MLTFHIVTIFPEMFDSYMNESLMKRAQKEKVIAVKLYDPRDFVTDPPAVSSGRAGKHKTARPTERRQSFGRVDDRPYGGGPGMVMKAEPLLRAVEEARSRLKVEGCRLKVVLTAPSGTQLTNNYAESVHTNYDNVILVCGRYEGIDARVQKILKKEGCDVEEVSIGPYTLTGGELPAMVLMDTVSRRIPGVLGNKDSIEEARTASSLVYTRPEVFSYKGRDYEVPKVLASGDHEKIEKWRKKRAH